MGVGTRLRCQEIEAVHYSLARRAAANRLTLESGPGQRLRQNNQDTAGSVNDLLTKGLSQTAPAHDSAQGSARL